MDILGRIEQYADLFGERDAFRSTAGTVTYGELWQKSGILASVIETLMGNDRSPLIVYGHKDPMMIICFLACARSGRAYCPVDTSLPPERLGYIRTIIGDPLLLSAEKGTGPLLQDECHILQYEEIERIIAANNCSPVPDPCSGEDLYYIIFTSGTTGAPKGVKITTNNLNHYLEWAVTLAGGICENAVFLNQAPYSFDLSVMDLYLSLATGGTVVSVDSKLQKDIGKLLAFFADQEITYWISTPSFADMCLADKRFDESVLRSMKAFLFCGEPLANETALSLIRRFPDTKVVNTYGPTESTVCVTEVCVTEKMAAGTDPLPVGKVKPGTKIVLDPANSEIIIIGDTVSPGYYKQPELTSQTFYTVYPTNLFPRTDHHPDTARDGVRAYRTGDKGHFDEHGYLYCDGRLDGQIKLHGYRIEIGDIEANLAGVPGIRRGAVAPRERAGKIDSLTAFIVRDGDLLPDDYSGRKAVRSALREKMPAYMVPKRILFVDELPLTHNGKLDRNRLKEMA